MRIKGFDPEGSTSSFIYEQQPVQDEFELESRLHQNPNLLLDDQILIIGRQLGVSTGTPDLVALDKYGNVVTFELKAGRSGTDSASEKSILGQPQSYARAVSQLEYDDLNQAYQEYCDDVKEGKWGDIETPVSSSSLQDAFESRFGRSLAVGHFNTHQRMVIVAEEITRTTEQNARHLVEEGLSMQCVEAQHLVHPDEDRALLATETVVDYPLQKVKPDHESADEFEELLMDIRNRARSELESVSFPVPLDYVTGTPRTDLEFVSEPVKGELKIAYIVRAHPEGYVTTLLRLYNFGDADEAGKDRIRSIIREKTDIPGDDRFSFDPASSTIVTKQLPVRTDTGEVTQESVSEIVAELVELIERTYPTIKRSMKSA